MKSQSTAKARKEYSKPVLRTIQLASDEVLAQGCKTNKGGFGSGATPCIPGNSCVRNGS